MSSTAYQASLREAEPMALPGAEKLTARGAGLPPERLIAALSASLTDAPGPLAIVPHPAPAAADDVDHLPVPMSRARRVEEEPDPDRLLSPVLTGGIVGLGLGLVLTAGLFIVSGGLEPFRLAPEAPAAIIRPQQSVAVAQLTSEAPTAVALQPTREAVTVAGQLIAGGDIAGARALLGQAASEGSAEAVLALAETFDPHVLAAWGVRDAEANPDLARQLYARALNAGSERARRRLEALD